MKALSIRQPYATLVAYGVKDIENRTTRTHFRGKIFIHASAKWHDRSKSNDAKDLFTWEQNRAIPHQLHGDFIDSGVIVKDDRIPLSAIIGEVEIIDCVVNHSSIWAEKTEIKGKTVDGDIMYNGKPIWNWVLANAVLYDKPILNIKGKLSFWEPDICLQKCESCLEPSDIEKMSCDDDSNWFCPECWKELAPVMAEEYKELKKKGEID